MKVNLFENIKEKFPMLKIIELEDQIYLYDAKSGLLSDANIKEIEYIYGYYNGIYDKEIPEY